MDGNRKIRRRLTLPQLRKYKAMLLAKRNEILANVASMEHEALLRDRSDVSKAPTHMADAGTDCYEIDNILGLMDSERRLLKQIDDALRRIEDGSYGICDGRGEPIPAKRLAAIPWAKYCVECASLAEKGLINRQAPSRSTGYDYGSDDEEDQDYGESYWRLERA